MYKMRLIVTSYTLTIYIMMGCNPFQKKPKFFIYEIFTSPTSLSLYYMLLRDIKTKCKIGAL